MVSRKTTMIGPKMFVLDYLLLPTFLPGQVRPKWDRFFARVHWDADFPLPPNFYTLVLADEPNGTSVSYHYKQMEPFNRIFVSFSLSRKGRDCFDTPREHA